MMTPSVSVVTVAYQSAHVIRRALTSIADRHEIICVDNASTDDLDAALSGLPVIRVRNEVNVGYGTACNQAAAIATGDFNLFMNPDVVLTPGAIKALVAASLRYPEASVFFPRTLQENGSMWFRDESAIEYTSDRPIVELRGDVAGDCCTRFVDGGVFMIRSSLFRDIGGFDENIFLYYEDDDLSIRLLARSEPIILVHDALAIHSVGQSTPRTPRNLITMNFHKKRSEIYVRNKHQMAYQRHRDLAFHFGKIAFYSMTFNVTRLLAAYGRMRGILSTINRR
jgi:N-acetylglucosaminyl-diphospho-decaprenol L-rhamnosyltransferase